MNPAVDNAQIKQRLQELQVELQVCADIQAKTFEDHTLRTFRIAEEIGELQNQMTTTFTCPIAEKNDAPEHVSRDYTMTFRDEFTGNSIDCSKWHTSLVWSRFGGPQNHLTINNELQYYVDTCQDDHVALGLTDPFTFTGDTVIITATEEQGPKTTNGPLEGQRFTSGVLTPKHEFTHGYVETCLKLPCGVQGSWAAFWLLNSYYANNNDPRATGPNGKFDPEIDFEWVNNPSLPYTGAGQNTLFAYHYDNAACNIDAAGFECGGQPALSQQCDGTQINFNQGLNPLPAPADFCTGFHTYGFDWCEDSVTYYVDGVPVRSICDPAIMSQVSMYPILNLAMGGSFGGNTPSGQAAAQMEIDYLRIYEKV